MNSKMASKKCPFLLRFLPKPDESWLRLLWSCWLRPRAELYCEESAFEPRIKTRLLSFSILASLPLW